MKKIFLFLMMSCLAMIVQAQSVQSTGGYNNSGGTNPNVSTATGILPVANGGSASSLATGTGSNVLGTAPTISSATLTASPLLVTPDLGVATATSVNKYTFVAPASSATLTIANGKGLNFANTMTITGTDATTFSFPATSDAIATLTVTQTFTNKTLTTPTIASFTNATHNHTNAAGGGTITKAAVSDLETISSGTYTPTLNNTTNIGASTAFSCVYQRVGSTVWVAGGVQIDITTTLAASELGISLPIASDFTTTLDGSGTGNGLTGDQSGNLFISSDITNNRMNASWQGQIGVGNYFYRFQFMYTIK